MALLSPPVSVNDMNLPAAEAADLFITCLDSPLSSSRTCPKPVNSEPGSDPSRPGRGPAANHRPRGSLLVGPAAPRAGLPAIDYKAAQLIP